MSMKKFQFQSGGKPKQEKGVFINSDAVDRQVPVRLQSGEVVYVQSIDNRYVNPDSIIPQDSVIVERGLLGNKATTFKSKNKIKPKQFGGEVLIEDNELYKDPYGNIVESDSFSHDDPFVLIDDQVVSTSNGNGGEVVDDAVEIASASYDQVKDGTRNNTNKEKKIAFKKKEGQKLLRDSGFSWFRGKGTMSPSELIKEAVDQRDKYFNQEVIGQDQYSQASTSANASMMPSEEDIFDIVFTEQERKKGFKDIDNAQYGGDIPVNLNGLYEEDGPVIVPSNSITMSGIDYPVDAYNADNGEYLTEMQPDMNYNFEVERILEVPKKQSGGYNRTEVVPNKTINVTGTQSQLNPNPNEFGEYTDQFGNIWTKNSGGEYEMIFDNKSNAVQPRQGNRPTTYSEYLEDPSDKYTVRSGDWLSSIAPMFGMSVEELTQLNPQIQDINRITPGQQLNIRRAATNTPQPVDRMSEIADLQELPVDAPVTQQAEEIPTLDVVAENVAPVAKEAAKQMEDVLLGRLDQNLPTNGLRARILASRNINPPYRAEVPNRLYGYSDEDVTPYLDEFDSSVTQALQGINLNTAQGIATQAAILNESAKNKRNVVNQVNARNLQRRQQIDNANIDAANRFDMMNEQNNASYVNQMNQTLANQDSAKIAVGDSLDRLEGSRIRTKNNLLMEAIKYPNFKVDPVTGEIKRIGSSFNDIPVKSARYGLRKK